MDKFYTNASVFVRHTIAGPMTAATAAPASSTGTERQVAAFAAAAVSAAVAASIFDIAGAKSVDTSTVDTRTAAVDTRTVDNSTAADSTAGMAASTACTGIVPLRRT